MAPDGPRVSVVNPGVYFLTASKVGFGKSRSIRGVLVAPVDSSSRANGRAAFGASRAVRVSREEGQTGRSSLLVFARLTRAAPRMPWRFARKVLRATLPKRDQRLGGRGPQTVREFGFPR